MGGPLGTYEPPKTPINRRPAEQTEMQKQKPVESRRSIDDSYKRYVDKTEITELQGKTIDKIYS